MKDLFLLPFAGGTSMVYSRWELKDVKLHLLDYRGHGLRFREELDKNEDEMILDLTNQIQTLAGEEFYIFGHSMGGLMTWMITKRLEAAGAKLPQRIFVSACEPPNYIDTGRYRMLKTEDAVRDYLIQYNRVPEDRLKTSTFKKVMFPAIKNDFRIMSEHKSVSCTRLKTPMTLFGSKDDQIMPFETMYLWEEFSENHEFVEVKGEHFYLEEKNTRDYIMMTVERIING